MYGDQVYTKRSTHAGVVSKTRNYVMYEDVDELEKFRRKRQVPVMQESRPEPFYDPLDNYRYYEDLTLRDKRKKSLVKHERTGEPVGRETPFLRDSFKKTVVNNVPSSNTFRSHSNERGYRRQAPRQAPRPELRQGPRPGSRPGSRRGSRQSPRQSPRQGPRPGPRPGPDLFPISNIIIRIILHFLQNKEVALAKIILFLDNLMLDLKEANIISIQKTLK